MDDRRQIDSNIIELIKQILETKIGALESKIDLMIVNQNTKHDSLESRVEALEKRPEKSMNIKEEIIKSLITWGIPFIVMALLFYVRFGPKVA
jgi:DNA-binding protein H-NS